MKYILPILLLMIPLISSAQFDFADDDWAKKIIGFGCGAGGRMTDLTANFHYLFAKKDFNGIKEKLKSEIAGERFLASFVLEKLQEKQELNLAESEIERIEKIKQSAEVVPVCSGCTYLETVPLHELWNRNHLMYKSAEGWFKFYYKMNYKKK